VLCLGGAGAQPTLHALAWIGILLAATIPTAVQRYRLVYR
jgi:hypothetical protein